jgi:Cytochrome P460
MHAALKYCGAVGSCAAVAVCTLYIAKSAAQSGKAGQPPAAAAQNSSKAVPIFGITIPAGYRDWKLVSVAHEDGSLNDIRAILGNDAATKAYREARLPFPDGAIIARLAWNHVPSEENNKAFGHAQSFVAGSAPVWHLQFMVKDSRKYAATEGWGYAQFDKDGNPADEAKLKTCAPCHEPAKANDFVFTHYSP